MSSKGGEGCSFSFYRFFNVFVSVMLVGLFTAGSALALSEEEKKDIGIEVTKLYRAARAINAKSQALINDPEKGDKGLTPDKMVNDVKAAVSDFKMADKSTLKGQAQVAMLDAIQETMKNAQPLINQKGKAFKGFIPAVFGKQVADSFTKTMAGKAFIKLTAPKEYVRNRANRPDEWESKVIETQFKKAGYDKDKPVIEVAPHNGRSALRLIIPEYYGEACMSCHGEPKGEVDITGSKKEGAKLGDLGGAISFAIYD